MTGERAVNDQARLASYLRCSGVPLTEVADVLGYEHGKAANAAIKHLEMRRKTVAIARAKTKQQHNKQTVVLDPEHLPLLLTVPQAAAWMGVSKNTIQRLMDSGDLPSLKLGSHFRRLPKAGVEAYVRRASEGGAA